MSYLEGLWYVCIVFGVHCLCESVEEPKILCLDSECAG